MSTPNFARNFSGRHKQRDSRKPVKAKKPRRTSWYFHVYEDAKFELGWILFRGDIKENHTYVSPKFVVYCQET